MQPSGFPYMILLIYCSSVWSCFKTIFRNQGDLWLKVHSGLLVVSTFIQQTHSRCAPISLSLTFQTYRQLQYYVFYTILNIFMLRLTWIMWSRTRRWQWESSPLLVSPPSQPRRSWWSPDRCQRQRLGSPRTWNSTSTISTSNTHRWARQNHRYSRITAPGCSLQGLRSQSTPTSLRNTHNITLNHHMKTTDEEGLVCNESHQVWPCAVMPWWWRENHVVHKLLLMCVCVNSLRVKHTQMKGSSSMLQDTRWRSNKLFLSPTHTPLNELFTR